MTPRIPAFVCAFLLVATLQAQLADLAPGIQPGPTLAGAPDEPGFGNLHRQWVLENNPIGDVLLLGVVRLDGRLYVSGSNGQINPNKLYVIDEATGSLLLTVDQPTISALGMRDLATDGRYIYGGDESLWIQVFDTTANWFVAPIDVTAAAQSAGITTVRALAWVKNLPNMPQAGFAFANWAGNIAFVDLYGSLVTTVPNPFTGLYGLSYLPWLRALFGCSQSPAGGGTAAVHCAGIDPQNGQILPNQTFVGDLGIGGIAGGVELDWSYEDAKILMTAVHQATLDTVASYEVGLLSKFEVSGSACGSAQPVAFPHTHPDVGNTGFGIDMFSSASAGIGVALVGFSDTTWNGQALPYNLSPHGFAGCSLAVSPDITIAALITPDGHALAPLPLPPIGSLVGAELFAQWLTLSATDDVASWGTKLKVFARGRALASGANLLLHGTLCVVQFNAVQVWCLANTGTTGQMRACMLNQIDDPSSMPQCTAAEKKFYRTSYQ